METLSLRHIEIDSRGLPEVNEYENIIKDLSLRLMPTDTAVGREAQLQPQTRQQSVDHSSMNCRNLCCIYPVCHIIMHTCEQFSQQDAVRPETPTLQISFDGEWMLVFFNGQNLLIKVPPSSHEERLPLTAFRLGVTSQTLTQFEHEAGPIA